MIRGRDGQRRGRGSTEYARSNTKPCQQPGCEKKEKSRGYCNQHYLFHKGKGTLPPSKAGRNMLAQDESPTVFKGEFQKVRLRLTPEDVMIQKGPR